jgi:hypothetical protein
MVRTYAYVEEILVAAKDVERVLGELSETPFELLKENKRKGCIMICCWRSKFLL